MAALEGNDISESLIGASIPRVEDERLLAGKGRYVGDIRLPGMLYAAFVRCPLGSTRVVKLNLDTAQNMPGVAAVFSANDHPVLGRPVLASFPVPGLEARLPSPLASDIIRFAGEAVAVVLADDPYRAIDGAAAVEVEFENLPCVVDPDKALLKGAPLVHSDVPGNLAGTTVHGYGDVESAFRDAPVSIRERLQAERMAGAAMEPRCVLAAPGGEGDFALTVYASTQAPHNARRGLAEALGMDPQHIRVIVPDVGGGFGPKGRLYTEDIAVAALALNLKRPVMWPGSRNEDFLTTFQGRGAIFEAEVAAEADGRLRGMRVRIIQDVGAYAATALMVSQNSAQHLLGPYRWPAVEFEISGVYTNKAPLTPLRGGGRELGVWATERMMDHLARRLNLDPLTVRERNLIRSDEFPFDTGYPSRFGGGTLTYDSGDYHGCLERCKELIGYDETHVAQAGEREQGRYRGVAVTLFLESTGMAGETARAELKPDGRISLRIGSPSQGQGHATTMAQMFGERFGVAASEIDYASGDTAAVDEGIGTFGSRMAVIAGNAAAMAGTQLRARVLETASDMLEAAVEDLEIVSGGVQVRGVPDRAIPLSEVSARAIEDGTSRAVDATYTAEKGSSFAGGAHGAVVDVDIETGIVKVEKYVVVHDCGTVINPLLVEGQVHGGVVHGLGNALKERMVYGDDGRLRSNSFLRYSMPLAADVPRIIVDHHESPSPYNPEGIKGAGEGGTIGALATVARAIEDALDPAGVTIKHLPITQEDIFWMCEPLRRRDDDRG